MLLIYERLQAKLRTAAVDDAITVAATPPWRQKTQQGSIITGTLLSAGIGTAKGTQAVNHKSSTGTTVSSRAHPVGDSWRCHVLRIYFGVGWLLLDLITARCFTDLDEDTLNNTHKLHKFITYSSTRTSKHGVVL